ncbi:hypothetical protein [Gimesia sp.]|uniref:hypothetical protein n=1 Tax=Gimesia sp. TaxID=2024833 RepID=UPI000C39161D|nr:hypothetical protein [Gimesia sp.]MAX35115.1 hypothetical protein [Gimesia sp.]HBL42536.1 hypothetical protein [Planctomycetaceae bacterium]|tara:strand:+ start:2065 stop:4086 length:2022 start_codon:yes stop_codon:yes gene_type:complete
MSEETRPDQKSQAPSPFAGVKRPASDSADSRPLNSAPGIERRADAPHSFTEPGVPEEGSFFSDQKQRALEENLSHAGQAAEIQTQGAAEAGASLTGAELLSQAGEIANYLKSQFAEISRREQTLTSQLNEIDNERRKIRMWVGQIEEQYDEREASVRDKETELIRKAVECEKLAKTVQREQEKVFEAQDSLEQERAEMRDHILREFAEQRETLERQKLDLINEQKRIREQVLESLSEQRNELEQARAEWQGVKQTELNHLKREREVHEEAVRKVETELNSRKEKFELELKTRQSDWDSKRQAELEALESRKRDFVISSEEIEHQLKIQREDLQREYSAREEEFDQKRTLIENRIKFQENHLLRLRKQIEKEQHDFQRQQQIQQQQHEQNERIHILRMKQLDRFRDLLQQREQSLTKERALHAELRRSVERYEQNQKQRMSGEYEVWQKERDAQKAELRRQHDMLALHAENLERRRERLDTLRAEVEETHRGTLEMRLALEEGWAQLTQLEGDDAARERLEKAREALAAHYRQLRESLSVERQELDHSQELFHRHRDEFRQERQDLSEWVAERDEQLRQRSEQLRFEAEQLAVRDAAWGQKRENWLQEKVSAEEVIRNLLEQLTELTVGQGAAIQLAAKKSQRSHVQNTAAKPVDGLAKETESESIDEILDPRD